MKVKLRLLNIFNFSMKCFISKVALFLLPITLFLIGYEILIRNVENEYSYKNYWLSENSKGIELLAIGSSHCYCGIDPDFLSIKAFNAGHPSQDIKYDFLIFNKFYEKLDSLQYLIVTVSYGDPFYSIEDRPNANAILKNYAIYYRIPTEKFRHNFEILNGVDFNTVKNILLKESKSFPISKLGFYLFPVGGAKDWQRVAPARAKESSFQYEVPLYKKLMSNYDNNVMYMEKTISLCNSKNIKVILLTTPIHKTFRDNINQEEWASTIDFCEHFTQEFNNVSYLNLFEDPRFLDEDFYDSDHLNSKGAAKLSSILNAYICNNFCLGQ